MIAAQNCCFIAQPTKIIREILKLADFIQWTPPPVRHVPRLIMYLILIWFRIMDVQIIQILQNCSCRQEIFRNLLRNKMTTNLSQATCMSISDQAAVFAPV